MIEEHLKLWLAADSKVSEIKGMMKALDGDLRDAEKEAEAASMAIAEEMAETGEYELNIKGEYCDYKIYYTTPRESVKVEPEAVPDEFCKIERKPKLREIGDYIRSLETPPNWGRIELGTPSLTYKIMKRG